MRYIVVKVTNIDEDFAIKLLQEEVNKQIKQFMKPQGGISITFNSDTKMYVACQAMVEK